MPLSTFKAFQSELIALKEIISQSRNKTLRDNSLRERFRTLLRSWASVVKPTISPFIQRKSEYLKLNYELDALAKLTTKYSSIDEYKKRLNRSIRLANNIVLQLPPSRHSAESVRHLKGEELFVSGIPDLTINFVPNPLLGWRSKIEEFVKKYPYDKSVFVMIRYRKKNNNVISRIKTVLGNNGYNGILASEHNLTDDLYNPIACLLCCSMGVAVFDKAESNQTFNPNVAYELGIMHILGRKCCILKHKTLTVLHTDILMKLYLPYKNVRDVEREINDWITKSD